MNTPRKIKRAKDYDRQGATAPSNLALPIDDRTAAFLGHIATRYTHLEENMIGVFRVILDIANGEFANLAFRALKSANARSILMKQVIESGHAHQSTSQLYDEIIAEFREATLMRNAFIHGVWWSDLTGKRYLETADGKEESRLHMRHVPDSEFEACIKRMDDLKGRIRAETKADRRALDARWMAQRQR